MLGRYKKADFAGKLDLGYLAMNHQGGQSASMAWLQMLLRNHCTKSLKPTESLWSPYSINCWWYEIFELARKLGLTGLPLITRKWLPGLDAEALYGEMVSGLPPAVYVTSV